MPVSLASLQIQPFAVDGRLIAFRDNPPPMGWTGGVRYRGVHVLYPLNSCLVDCNYQAPTPLDAREHLSFVPNALGNTVYLHYEWNIISSVRLPNPAPAHLNLFVTDNMSGCKFFVDTVNGSTDLVVYHANTQLHGAGALADVDVQSVAASTLLDQMHTDAMLEYAPVGLAAAAECAKPVYFRNAGNSERGYRYLGYRGTNPLVPRQDPSFFGGATIVGIPNAGTRVWEFWFQTAGAVDRQMPATVEQRPWYRRNVNHPAHDIHPGTDITAVTVVQYGQIF